MAAGNKKMVPLTLQGAQVQSDCNFAQK